MGELELWEILVPTEINKLSGDGKVTDEIVPIKLRYHRLWDKYVRSLSGGLTVFRTAIGQWVYEGELFKERMIPVRIACSKSDMEKIAEFTKIHYRQIKVMYYNVSREVYIV